MAVPLALALLACGGAKGSGAAPGWDQPVALDGASYQRGLSLSGDGHGQAVAAWLRSGPSSTTEVVVARILPDGTWDSPHVLEAAESPMREAPPMVAVDARGKGLVAWVAINTSSTGTMLRAAKVDLGAATVFSEPETVTTNLTTDLTDDPSLGVAVGSDDSAMLAWSFLPADGQSAVEVTRRDATGQWAAPVGYVPHSGYRQSLVTLAGDGLGAYLLETMAGQDAITQTGALAFAPGSFAPVGLAGWEPDAQYALPEHLTAVATDGQGALDTWLLYLQDTKVYPRQKSAAGEWTVGPPVTLPLAANQIAVSREPDGTGWLAGSGDGGLWIAPLAGPAIGTPRQPLGSAVGTDGLVATRDAAGRPGFMWLQREQGSVLGLGETRWDGQAWSTPTLVPGTALATSGFAVQPGPDGLVAIWAEAGSTGARLMSARWH